MNNEITDRLNQFILAKTKTRRAFASLMGISAVAIDNYANGKRVPPTDLLVNALRAYPDISAEWLMRGEGSMYRENTATINYEVNTHSQINKGNVKGSVSYNGSASCEEELKTLKEKEKLYLLQIAELKNDKLFLQSIIKNQ